MRAFFRRAKANPSAKPTIYEKRSIMKQRERLRFKHE